MPHRSLQFVMFHAFKGRDAAAEEMIRMAGESIRRHYANADIVLLTNTASVSPSFPDWLTVLRAPVDFGKIMFERISRYHQHLERPDAARHVVFIDTDMLMVRPIDDLLADAADLTVTVRRWNKEAPINGGLYVVNTRRLDRVRRFFKRFVDHYRGMSADMLRWDGDQTVIAELLARDGLPETLPAVAETPGLRVRYVSVDEFNNTPSSLLLRLALFNPVARILHFKGRRKERMALYDRLYGRGSLGGLLARCSA